MKKIFLTLAVVGLGMSSVQVHAMNVGSMVPELELSGVGGSDARAALWNVMFGCSSGVPSEDIVEELRPILAAGVNVDEICVTEGQDCSPVAYAVHYGYGEVVRLLVAHGADLHQTFSILNQNNGQQQRHHCLSYAALVMRNRAMVALLLELGAQW